MPPGCNDSIFESNNIRRGFSTPSAEDTSGAKASSQTTNGLTIGKKADWKEKNPFPFSLREFWCKT
jgi:hypothetical protein